MIGPGRFVTEINYFRLPNNNTNMTKIFDILQYSREDDPLLKPLRPKLKRQEEYIFHTGIKHQINLSPLGISIVSRRKKDHPYRWMYPGSSLCSLTPKNHFITKFTDEIIAEEMANRAIQLALEGNSPTFLAPIKQASDIAVRLRYTEQTAHWNKYFHVFDSRDDKGNWFVFRSGKDVTPKPPIVPIEYEAWLLKGIEKGYKEVASPQKPIRFEGKLVQKSKSTYSAMSRRTKRKIYGKAEQFFLTSKNKLVFMTLTFQNKVYYKKMRECFARFENILRKRHPDMDMLWVQEYQEKNERFPDNLHLHVLINVFLPVKEYQEIWTRIQIEAGVIHPEGLTPSNLDLRSVYGISQLANYLGKYIGKGSRPMRGLKWNSSKRISMLSTSQILDNRVLDAIEVSGENFRVDKDTGEVIYAEMVHGDFWSYYPFLKPGLGAKYSLGLTAFNKKIMRTARDKLSLIEMPLIKAY